MYLQSRKQFLHCLSKRIIISFKMKVDFRKCFTVEVPKKGNTSCYAFDPQYTKGMPDENSGVKKNGMIRRRTTRRKYNSFCGIANLALFSDPFSLFIAENWQSHQAPSPFFPFFLGFASPSGAASTIMYHFILHISLVSNKVMQFSQLLKLLFTHRYKC